MGSFVEGSGDPTTQTHTPKLMEEVDVEIMKVDKAVELFQTMAIMSLNMGNLTLKINIIKNKLVVGEEGKATLHVELDKEINIQKGYKHNVEFGERAW